MGNKTDKEFIQHIVPNAHYYLSEFSMEGTNLPQSAGLFLQIGTSVYNITTFVIDSITGDMTPLNLKEIFPSDFKPFTGKQVYFKYYSDSFKPIRYKEIISHRIPPDTRKIRLDGGRTLHNGNVYNEII